MGKKGKSKKKGDGKHCAYCKNFDPDKKGGWCRNHDKKRSADDKACGDFKARKDL